MIDHKKFDKFISKFKNGLEIAFRCQDWDIKYECREIPRTEQEYFINGKNVGSKEYHVLGICDRLSENKDATVVMSDGFNCWWDLFRNMCHEMGHIAMNDTDILTERLIESYVPEMEKAVLCSKENQYRNGMQYISETCTSHVMER